MKSVFKFLGLANETKAVQYIGFILGFFTLICLIAGFFLIADMSNGIPSGNNIPLID